ncbi:MAG: 5'-methylthioadenosine/S-adenosylhomocysteine nucleosidase [Muribaculaceae bacterium]|nr:5'-methylthioadenosine/S-adenosylhomocysteine nucleosidase [Muribaculaceae bacterium]
MKILILAAMDKETDLLINLLENPEMRIIAGCKTWRGNIGPHSVDISRCGIGKVNSALNTLRFIQLIQPDLLLNSGVAGGAGVPIGTILVANKVAYHDVWCGPGTEYGQADGLPLFMEPYQKILEITQDSDMEQGLICSGDKFISTPEEINFIRSKFPYVKAVDMESASVAQTCIICGIPFAIVRVVSDTPGVGENISQYKDFWDTAPQKTFMVLAKILENL